MATGAKGKDKDKGKKKAKPSAGSDAEGPRSQRVNAQPSILRCVR